MTAASDVGSALSAQRERSRAQVARYHEIRAALEQLRVSSSSSDRTVTVELAAGGAIVDLRITKQAMSKTPDELSRCIMEAIRSGLTKVAEQTAARVEPLTGRRIDVSSVASGRLPSLRSGERSADDQAVDPIERPATAAAVAPSPPDTRFLPEEE